MTWFQVGKVYNRALQLPKRAINSTDMAVLAAMAYECQEKGIYVDKDGTPNCWKGQAKLGRLARLGRDAVGDAQDRLNAAGLIQFTGKRRRARNYRVIILQPDWSPEQWTAPSDVETGNSDYEPSDAENDTSDAASEVEDGNSQRQDQSGDLSGGVDDMPFSTALHMQARTALDVRSSPALANAVENGTISTESPKFTEGDLRREEIKDQNLSTDIATPQHAPLAAGREERGGGQPDHGNGEPDPGPGGLPFDPVHSETTAPPAATLPLSEPVRYWECPFCLTNWTSDGQLARKALSPCDPSCDPIGVGERSNEVVELPDAAYELFGLPPRGL